MPVHATAPALAGRGKALVSVATRNNALGQGTQTPPTGLSCTYRTQHTITQDCSDIRLVYGNWQYASAGAAEASGANAITVKAAIEYPGVATPGTRIPFTFNGTRAASIDPGATAVTEPLGYEFKKGDTLYIWTHVAVTSGTWPIGLQVAPSVAATAGGPYPSVQSVEANNFNEDTGDVTLSGSVVPRTGNAYSPSAILGRTAAPQPSVGIIGDSVASGFTDVLAYDWGYLVRALANNNIGYINVAHKGETAGQFSTYPNSYRRRRLLEYCTHVICNYGTNDLAAQVAYLTVATNLQAIWKSMASRGIPVVQTTITPRTTSTDAWVTTANQTVVNGTGQPRTDLNNWLRAGAPVNGSGVPVAVGTGGAVPSPYLAGVIDICPAVESGSTGLWLPNLTSDGVHPNTAGHTAMAALIPAASMFAL